MPTKRRRRVGSVTDELIQKSREAALSAVQIFNNPRTYFKSETFIVLMCIAWTYLLHAHYRKQKIDYRYYRLAGTRKRFDKTKSGAYKHWELERCLNEESCPIDRVTSNNLRFLIGLRHEIEHQMTTRIDDYLSARFQACCLNFNSYIKKLFGENKGIDRYLSFSLQLAAISEDQAQTLSSMSDLPHYLQRFIEGFDGELSEQDFNSPKYAYRVLFVAKTANRKGQADQVIEFVKADSPIAKDVNITYTAIKETERQKYLPSQIVAAMNSAGFPGFRMYHHTTFWQSLEAKNPGKGFGVLVANNWYWYESWAVTVEEHCRQSKGKYV